MVRSREKSAVYKACENALTQPMTERMAAAVEAEMPWLAQMLSFMPGVRMRWDEEDKDRWRYTLENARVRWWAKKLQRDEDMEVIRKAAHIDLGSMTPADFRAELVRYGVAEKDAVEQIGVSISHLSKVLHEKLPMSPRVRDRLGHLIAEEIRKKKLAKRQRTRFRQEGGGQTRRRMRGNEDA